MNIDNLMTIGQCTFFFNKKIVQFNSNYSCSLMPGWAVASVRCNLVLEVRWRLEVGSRAEEGSSTLHETVAAVPAREPVPVPMGEWRKSEEVGLPVVGAPEAPLLQVVACQLQAVHVQGAEIQAYAIMHFISR